MATPIAVLMSFTDGNAQSTSVNSWRDAVETAAMWLDEWCDSPSSEPVPGIVSIELTRVEPIELAVARLASTQSGDATLSSRRSGDA